MVAEWKRALLGSEREHPPPSETVPRSREGPGAVRSLNIPKRWVGFDPFFLRVRWRRGSAGPIPGWRGGTFPGCNAASKRAKIPNVCPKVPPCFVPRSLQKSSFFFFPFPADLINHRPMILRFGNRNIGFGFGIPRESETRRSERDRLVLSAPQTRTQKKGPFKKRESAPSTKWRTQIPKRRGNCVPVYPSTLPVGLFDGTLRPLIVAQTCSGTIKSPVLRPGPVPARFRVPFIACQHVSLPLETRRRFSGRDRITKPEPLGPGSRSISWSQGGFRNATWTRSDPPAGSTDVPSTSRSSWPSFGLFTNTGSGPVQGSWNWGAPGNSWDRSRCIRRKS